MLLQTSKCISIWWEALASRPAARQLILRLGAIDLPSGAPPIKQLHSHTVITEDSMAQYLATAFNIPATYTNALVIVDQQQIHAHKVIMAQACTALADHWACTNKPLVIDTICTVSGIRVSYNSTLIFIRCLYTGVVVWPAGQPGIMTAKELLILASTFDVPFLVRTAELMLQPAVNVDNCCHMFESARCYSARQLQAYCLCFTASDAADVASWP